MKVNLKNFHDRSLCDRCEHSSIIKTKDDKRRVYCAEIFKFVPPNIEECSDFQGKGTLNKYDMEKTAWTIEVKNGKTIGFKPPETKPGRECG